MTQKLYRPNVGIMLLNNKGDVFMAHRTDARREAWQMPQGGIDKHEDEMEAARRELCEETGITSIKMIAEAKNWYCYDFPQGVHFLSEKKKYFAGQKQKWFLFEFTGDESEINLDQPDAEFDAWMWMPVEEVAEVIVAFKKEVYKNVINEFMPFIDAVRDSRS